MVPPIGKAGITFTPSGGVSGTGAAVLNLTDMIVTEGLVSVYNFLETNVEDPSGVLFTVLNCAGQNLASGLPGKTYNNAKLVAEDSSSVFTSGLAVPFLSGLAAWADASVSGAGTANALGSFLMLPDTPEYRNLGYCSSGFSIETWLHMPTLAEEALDSGWGLQETSSLSRIILACENSGGVSSTEVSSRIQPNYGTDRTRGMLFGITRDRRIVTGEDSTEASSNHPITEMSLFVAPTQSFDTSHCTFINNVGCGSGAGWFNMNIRTSATPTGYDKSVNNCSAEYVLVNLSVDPRNNEVRMYLDGRLLGTSSITSVFGTGQFEPPRIPTFAKTNSWEYETSGHSDATFNDATKFRSGPRINVGAQHAFTPWIIGGGYTDARKDNDNFMEILAGKTSGLKGHVGSFKVYSKALNTTEARRNFDAQQGFFKNISV